MTEMDQASPDPASEPGDREGFIASLAHEVRTPLTAVIGMLEMLVGPPALEADDAAEFLQTAHTQAVEVGRVLDDLVAAVRLSSHAMTVRLRPFAVDPVISAAVGMVPVPVGTALTIEGQCGDCVGDPIYVRQLLRAVLKNAIKFASSSVTVRCGRTPAFVVVDIVNDGPLIPLHQVPSVFEPYMSEGRAGDNGSLGLGLAIARQLARLMGGDVVHLAGVDEVVFRVLVPAGEEVDVTSCSTLMALPNTVPSSTESPVCSPVVQMATGTTAGYLCAAPDSTWETVEVVRRSMPPNTLLFLPVPVDGGLLVATDANRLVAVVEDDRWSADRLTGFRGRGGMVAAPVGGDHAWLVEVRPDFLLVDGGALVAPGGGASMVLGQVAALALELDAWVMVRSVTTAEQLAIAREHDIPLAAGPMVGVAAAGWPSLSGAARSVLTRSPLESRLEATMATLIGAPGQVRLEVGEGMTALAADSITHTLARAMQRPRRQRFAPVTVIDSIGRSLGPVGIDQMIQRVIDREKAQVPEAPGRQGPP